MTNNKNNNSSSSKQTKLVATTEIPTTVQNNCRDDTIKLIAYHAYRQRSGINGRNYRLFCICITAFVQNRFAFAWNRKKRQEIKKKIVNIYSNRIYEFNNMTILVYLLPRIQTKNKAVTMRWLKWKHQVTAVRISRW